MAGLMMHSYTIGEIAELYWCVSTSVQTSTMAASLKLPSRSRSASLVLYLRRMYFPIARDSETDMTAEEQRHHVCTRTLRLRCSGLLCSMTVKSTLTTSYSAPTSSRHNSTLATFVDCAGPNTFTGVIFSAIRAH
ncbi:Os01g0371300, partial [Oryza sativa Japonica Group]